MFAVVRTGGKQYRVHPGDKIVVEKLDGNAGDKITLGDVLLAGDGGSLKSTGGLTVAAEIVAQAKGDKVTVFKKRRRHNYRRKQGHRQLHTILKIVAIGDHKEPKKTAPKAAAAPAEGPTAPAAPAKAKGKARSPEAAAQEAASEAQAETVPTPSPAPEDEAKANPAQSGDVEQPAKAAKPKKAAAAKASTSDAAPAKAAPKKKAK